MLIVQGGSDEHVVFSNKDGASWSDAEYDQWLCSLLLFLMGAMRRL